MNQPGIEHTNGVKLESEQVEKECPSSEWFALLSHIEWDPEAYKEALGVLEWIKTKHHIN